MTTRSFETSRKDSFLASLAERVVNYFQFFVFDVDGTIAENNEDIPISIIESLADLLQYGHIVLVTARSMTEGLDRFAKLFSNAFTQDQRYTTNKLYLFPTTASQAFQMTPGTHQIEKLYSYTENDENYGYFYNNYKQDFLAFDWEIDPDISYDDSKKRVQIKDRESQVTLFFSNLRMRTEYAAYMYRTYAVNAIAHGRNVLHVLPQGVNKDSAIMYLNETLSFEAEPQFLVFGDGFHKESTTGRIGNDLSFAEKTENITCISVGERMPQPHSAVWHSVSNNKKGYEKTLILLEKILSGATCDKFFKDLMRTQKDNAVISKI